MRSVLYNASTYRDGAGKAIGIFAAARDVTERKKTAEALGEANQRLRIYERLVEGSPNMVVVVDRGYVYRMANAAFLGRRGKNADEILGHTVEEVLGKKGFELVRPYLDQCMAGSVTRFGDWFSYPDIGRRFMEISYYPLPDENGQTDVIVAELHDATDRKQAEEALRQSEAMLSCILNSLPLSIFWKNRESVYLGCNETFARGANLRPEDVVGETDFDLPWSREETEAYRADDREVMTSGRAKIHIIEPQHRADGTCIWLDTTKIPLFDADGKVYGVVGIYDDVTQRKRMEDDLHKAKEAAEAANRAKSEFLANMSHEIRTPMTAILGFSDLLATGNLPREEQREFLEGIQRNGKALLELIGDILDLSRIEADKLTLATADCSLQQIMDDVLSVVQVRAREKGLSLEVDYHDPLPEMIHTAPARLRQILVNLVGNAVKFTAQGEVRIAVRSTARRRRGCANAVCRFRHRHRHLRRQDRRTLPALYAGGYLGESPLRRGRPRPGHLPASGPGARRAN